jgi:hypothetical protein
MFEATREALQYRMHIILPPLQIMPPQKSQRKKNINKHINCRPFTLTEKKSAGEHHDGFIIVPKCY